jgi:TolB-like protein/DNA-binding winged helix-turn-helix (wHTH) protein/tetratricopeptide (TPR) repeat protein
LIFTVNDCSIDTEAYEIRRNGTPVAVEPQVFDLLVLLLESAGRVVTKDEIIDRVWHGRIVSEAALSSRIKAVRQAIGDDGTSQACIRTIRRRGFRLIADVTRSDGDAGAIAASPTETPADIPAESANPRAPLASALSPVPTRAVAAIDGTAGRSVRPDFRLPARWRAAAVAAVVAIAALALTTAWLAFQPRDEGTATVNRAFDMPTGPGIAVRMFKNLSDDSTLDFFGTALTESITTELTRFSELRVASRTLTAPYDQRDILPLDLGRNLGAEFLVQGSLQRSNERMRVTAQLIKTRDGTVLWAEVYERHLTPADVFSVQEDVTSKVVAAVASISAGVIARETLGRARGKPPRELSAYACTIRANEIMSSGYSAASHLAIRTCLEAAIAAEPDYAAAWAMLAWMHTLEYSQGYNQLPGADGRERGLAAARRAIELAPANPMARFAMARASYLMRDLDLFYAEAAHALRLNPHEPFLLGNLGNWLAFSGRWDEGVALVRKAIALNPKVYPRWWHAAIGKDHYRKGQFQEALVEFKTMNLPGWWWNQVELAYTYGQLGDTENARTAVTRLLELYPGFDLDKAVMEHRKFSFQPSYIELAVDGLRKAGVPEKAPKDQRQGTDRDGG